MLDVGLGGVFASSVRWSASRCVCAEAQESSFPWCWLGCSASSLPAEAAPRFPRLRVFAGHTCVCVFWLRPPVSEAPALQPSAPARVPAQLPALMEEVEAGAAATPSPPAAGVSPPPRVDQPGTRPKPAGPPCLELLLTWTWSHLVCCPLNQVEQKDADAGLSVFPSQTFIS